MPVWTPEASERFTKIRWRGWRTHAVGYHRSGNPGDSAIGIIRDFLTFLAKMGLTVRDDPKKVVDIAGRTWGEPVDDLTLSMRWKGKEDPDELPAVSVAICNVGAVRRTLRTRGWVDFFHVTVRDAAGRDAELTSYGRELMKPEHARSHAEVELEPGEAAEAEIPIGSIYRMKGTYHVRASCATPDGGRAISNEIEVSA